MRAGQPVQGAGRGDDQCRGLWTEGRHEEMGEDDQGRRLWTEGRHEEMRGG